MTLERTENVSYTVGRYITYEGLNEPTLWLAAYRDMNQEEALASAKGRNIQMGAHPHDYDSPESPFFAVKITRKETLERVE